ncbi:MAG: endonuclease/exonuclease/phosphatase family protein [Anaerolineae bacterium]
MQGNAQRKSNLFIRVIDVATLLYLVISALYLVVRGLVGDSVPFVSLVNSFAYFLFLPLPVLLALAAVVRSKKAFLRLLPIVAVIAVWVGPRFLPRSTVQAGNDTLQVMSLNTWGNNHDLTQTEAWLRETGADIVVLVEVSPAYARDRLPGLNDLYPYQTNQRDETRWGDNFILSRYPIVSSDYVDLGVPNQPAPVRAVVDVDGQQVAVYAVHLAWPVDDEAITSGGVQFYFDVARGFDDRIRNLQIQGLIERWKSESLPYIAAGDFNTSDFSVTYSRLASASHDSFAEGGWGLGGSWPVAWVRTGLPDWLPPLIRIDYIWHSDKLRTVRSWQGPAVGSDHLPLFAELAVG